jgi:hypothetical protein
MTVGHDVIVAGWIGDLTPHAIARATPGQRFTLRLNVSGTQSQVKLGKAYPWKENA